MTWTDHYWDAVNEFYWVPSYLGLKSISRKKWEVEGDRVSIPKQLTNPNGPLYRRIVNSTNFPEFVRRQEETFTHIFNLTFSMLPGSVISEIFGGFIDGEQGVDYSLATSDDCRRYPWIADGNVTTPDAFFLADNAVLAVEIKFNARTSLDQLAKYVALIAGEVVFGKGQRDLALVYIFPKDAEERFFKDTSIAPRDLDESVFPLLIDRCKNKAARDFLQQESQTAERVLSALDLSCITWGDLRTRLVQISESLTHSCGDQTLAKVLGGLQLEIERHPLSGVG